MDTEITQKDIEKINKRIIILATAIAEQQRHGQVSIYIMRDIEHIILEESLENELEREI